MYILNNQLKYFVVNNLITIFASMNVYDKFQNDFNFASTVEDKQKLIDDFSKENDIDSDELTELKLQIQDLVETDAINEDIMISLEIEDGKFILYSCIKDIDCYKSGSNYYIKVDDPKEFYLSTGIGETNSQIQNMINSIKPIYYIVVDDGIGTLKRKNIFPNDDFSDYFTKFA